MFLLLFMSLLLSLQESMQSLLLTLHFSEHFPLKIWEGNRWGFAIEDRGGHTAQENWLVGCSVRQMHGFFTTMLLQLTLIGSSLSHSLCWHLCHKEDWAFLGRTARNLSSVVHGHECTSLKQGSSVASIHDHTRTIHSIPKTIFEAFNWTRIWRIYF